jgi:hypothetical protein
LYSFDLGVDLRICCQGAAALSKIEVVSMAEQHDPIHTPPIQRLAMPLPQVNTGSLPGATEGNADEDAEWEAIARESLNNDELDAVAKHLRATGQASA